MAKDNLVFCHVLDVVIGATAFLRSIVATARCSAAKDPLRYIII